LGCAAGDAGCLCQNEDFAFGVSDCSKANCPPEYYKKVEADVEAWCAGEWATFQHAPFVSAELRHVAEMGH